MMGRTALNHVDEVKIERERVEHHDFSRHGTHDPLDCRACLRSLEKFHRERAELLERALTKLHVDNPTPSNCMCLPD